MQIFNPSTMWNLRMIAYFVLGLGKSRQADCWASQWAAPQGKHHPDCPLTSIICICHHTHWRVSQTTWTFLLEPHLHQKWHYKKVSLQPVQVLFDFCFFNLKILRHHFLRLTFLKCFWSPYILVIFLFIIFTSMTCFQHYFYFIFFFFG